MLVWEDDDDTSGTDVTEYASANNAAPHPRLQRVLSDSCLLRGNAALKQERRASPTREAGAGCRKEDADACGAQGEAPLGPARGVEGGGDTVGGEEAEEGGQRCSEGPLAALIASMVQLQQACAAEVLVC